MPHETGRLFGRQAGSRRGPPRVVALHFSPLSREALETVAESMAVLSPSVEIVDPDLLLLDASAASLLSRRRGLEGERMLAEQACALAAGLGHRCRGAVASGRWPAGALARHGDGPACRPNGPVTCAAPGETALVLAGLPIEALEVDPEVARTFGALGLRRLGDLAALPVETLAHRFGPAGLAAARLARGEDETPLSPHVPDKLPQESLDLAGTEAGLIESSEALLFAVKRLADRLGARLAGRGLGAVCLELALELDGSRGRAEPEREIRLRFSFARPSASPIAWMIPVRERIAALTLPAPVGALRIAVLEAAQALPEQLGIGDRPEVFSALEGVLARLSARLGDSALFAAEPENRYRPEGAYRPRPFLERSGRGGGKRPQARAKPAESGTAAKRRRKAQARPPELLDAEVDFAPVRPTRLLAEPLPVIAEGEGGGRLTAIRFDGRAHTVLSMTGPERLRGEWWNEPFDRDYFRVELEDVGSCWTFRSGQDGRLYLHGFFD